MKSPENDPSASRCRTLEDSFFAERDRPLLARLRGELGQLEERQKLASVSGIQDDQVLKDLIDSGIRAETMAAIRLIPLVVVAWSDGRVSEAESKAVLRAASEDGVNEGSACHELLSKWLQNPPDASTVTTWKEYMRGLTNALPAESQKKLRDDLKRRLQSIAKAAGGFLGLQTVSQQEQSTIHELVEVVGS